MAGERVYEWGMELDRTSRALAGVAFGGLGSLLAVEDPTC